MVYSLSKCGKLRMVYTKLGTERQESIVEVGYASPLGGIAVEYSVLKAQNSNDETVNKSKTESTKSYL